jgi:hypothetical protein
MLGLPLWCAAPVRWAGALALAVLSLGVLLPNLPAGRAPQEDAGVFMYVASVALDGGLPYRDVWDHKPPGVYALTALGLALGGRSEIGVWGLELAALLTAAILGYAALARSFGIVAAFFASVAWLVAAPRLFLADGAFTIFAEYFGLPLQFALLFLVATSPRITRPGGASTTRARDLAIGLLGGTAFLLKPTLVGLWIAFAIVLAIAYLRDGRSLVARLIVIALGAAAPLVAAVIVFLAGGALPDFWDQAFAYNVANSGTATAEDRVIAALTGMRLTAPSGLIALAALGWIGAVLAMNREGRRLLSAAPLLGLATLAAPLEIALASVSGRPYHYYYLAWLPSFAVLTAFVAQQVVALVPRRAAVLLAVLLGLSLAQPTLLLARLSTVSDDGLARAAVRYLVASTDERDTVLLWGARSEINFLSRRRAPTRYVYQYAPLYTRGYPSAERVAELMRDIERRRPVTIIDVSGSSFATPPLDVAAIRAWISPEPRYQPPPELERVAAYIVANYDRVGVVPETGWPVHRRRDSAGGSADGSPGQAARPIAR